jgi:SAM-dependent methyltransferase
MPALTPFDKFFRKFRKPREGRTLIVGSHIYGGREDRRKLYPDAVGVDMVAGPGVDVVADLEDWAMVTDLLQPASFDHVECRSVLEHSRRPWLLAQNLEALMKPGATFDFSVPFVWRVHAYPSDYFRYTAEGVRALFPGIDWTRIQYATDKHLSKIAKLEGKSIDGAVHLARCEVVAWGVRSV